MFSFLGRFVFRRRWFVLVATVAFLAISALTGLSVFDRLQSGGFEDPTSESARATAILEERFGAGSPDLVLLVSAAGEGVDSPAATQSGTDLTEQIAAEPGVEQVLSYWNAPQEGGGDPGLRSTDGDKALVLVRLAGDEQQSDAVSTRLQTTYDGTVGDLDVQIGGPGVGLGETIGADLARAESIAIPITLVLLLVVFGGAVAAVLPLAAAAMAILGTFLALYLVTLATDVSIFSINLATALGLGLAIDYSLLVVSRFREELGRGVDTQTAVARTLLTAGRTVVFSAVTVAVSLSALLIFPLYFLRSFAYAGIAVVAIAAAAAVLT
nr:MMPL family transporter [Nocardioidaceae bacterium]